MINNTANLTEGEGQIYATSLVQLCDLVAPLVCDLVAPLVCDLVAPLVCDLVAPLVCDLVAPLVLISRTSMRKVFKQCKIFIFSAIYFSLVWKSLLY